MTLSSAGGDNQLREKLARVVLDEMYQFVALLDVEGRLLEVNRAALDGGGIRFEEIEGKPFWTAHWWTISPQTQDALERAVRRAAAGEFIRYDVAVFGRGRGSETIVIDFSIKPVRDEQGRIVFLLPEGRDITEKKRVEDEVARKNAELEHLVARIRELDAAKSRFFANVSHELRTPLALILGPVERMADAAELDPVQRRDLEVVRRNAVTLLRHVNDLLDVSKVEAGEMQLRRGTVDLARLVRWAAAHFEELAARREIDYAVQAPEVLVGEVDAEKLERAILNLLSNAFKFSSGQGRVTLSLESTTRGTALIRVRDSGPGVSPALRERIFERFVQAQEIQTRHFGGTGLGLALVKDFVELHGGTVAVGDAPGGGAEFTLELPLGAPARTDADLAGGDEEPAELRSLAAALVDELALAAPDPTVAPYRAGDGRPRALVVEDNPEMRRFVAEVLSPDFVVRTAANGAEGLAATLEAAPDLIVTDVMMPVMSGAQLAQEVRTRPELDNVPILVLSAKADDQLRVELLRAAAQDYVVKPFAADELRARAANLVKVKRAREILQADLETRQRDLALLAEEMTASKRALRESASRLEATVTEKEVLLRELHHRVRNSLALVTSLLRLQAQATPDMAGRAALDACGERVISLTLVYEELHAGTSLVELELVRYLSRLGQALAASFADPEREVTVVVRGEPIRVRPTVAFPCGLIITELVTSAVRHAFANRARRRIEVTVGLTGDELMISVIDDGLGLRQSAETGPGSLGWTLVEALTGQLRGRVEFDISAGTRVTLRIPRERDRA